MGNPLKILIVEDNGVDRAIWKRHLSQSADRFECIEEVTGEGGLARCQEFQPDCILLDFNLPDITGIEFIRRLRGKHRCAVVVATAYGNEDVAVRSMKTGATDYLVKGAVTAEILKHALEGAVEKVRLQWQVEQHRVELEQRNRQLEESHRQLRAALDAELRARVSAEESGARYRKVTEAIPHVVWTASAPCRLVDVNSGWQHVTGGDTDSAMGDGWLAYVHNEDQARIERAWRESAGSTRPFEAQFRLKNGGGAWRWHAIRGVPYSDDGSTTWYGTLTDIEDRTRAEQLLNQRQKLESIGLLASGVAHDFNNLLVGVVGGVSLALDMLPDYQAARPLMENALHAAQRASAVTRQLLAYAGKTQFAIRRTNPSELVASTCRIFGSTLSKNVQLRVTSAPHLTDIEADPTQIQQVVMNLVINAAEAIGEKQAGSISVRTETRILQQAMLGACGREIGPGPYAVLEVTDTGCGMDEATKAKIFDPFFSTKILGRGLGLAAVHGIVESHRGIVQVWSEPGAGTTFRVWLPACSPEAPAVEEPERVQAKAPGGGGVLVVDDEAGVRMVAERALGRAGYRVWTAEDGERALEIAVTRGDAITAVLLDLSMPGMSGEETLRRMREAGVACPVIVSTGHGEVDIRRRLGSQPATAFLDKPYTAQELVRVVMEQCEAMEAGRK